MLGVLGLLICAAFPGSFFGAALSIAGLLQKDRQKVFPILGLVFNVAIALAITLLIVIGNQMPVGPTRGTSVALLGVLGLRA